ncbi:MAG TPA: primosomal protein N' [Desulfobacteraceae bacterium]|nr:primosomal protein N' [Desulfobacteraceae bacterium]
MSKGFNRVCARVAVCLPVKNTFSYTVPAALKDIVHVGSRVLVPFGARTVTGFVLECFRSQPEEGWKEIIDAPDRHPFFHPAQAALFEWISDYYLHPVGQVIRAALPGGLDVHSTSVFRLTGKGRRALESMDEDAPERPMLEWVRDHPRGGKRWPVSKLRALSAKGFFQEEDKPPGLGPGPVFRRFVRSLHQGGIDELKALSGGAFKAAKEREFLKTVFDAGTVPVSELTRLFSNGGYLLKKWAGKGILEVVQVPVVRDGCGDLLFPSTPPDKLFPQQEAAVSCIERWLAEEKFVPCLLYGVTGSGKTEVYCRAVEETVKRGKQALVMVPEISLATYMENIFRSRFKERVAIYHSNLTRGQRYDQWLRIAEGKVDLVVGARSALFAPLPRPGLIIVDEEFDSSYKQDTSPRYNARDAAVVRARIEEAVVILGSGSPSVQSYHNAVQGRYRLLTMPERVDSRPLPEVELVDMRGTGEEKQKEGMLGARLKEAVEDTMTKGEQVILFLNRRGFHRSLICRRCGSRLTCPNCDVALTYHLEDNRLTCHYCGYRCPINLRCEKCGNGELRSLGFGIERLEQELKDLFPTARVARLDTDSTRRRGRAGSILKSFGAGEIDILAGTQMITKGYDFPGVTLVGVVAADQSLSVPDFRASERTFQLLCQVSGRAGRGSRPGKVLIQTFSPEHYAVRSAMNHDYRAFFEREMALRAGLDYPPLSHMACLLLQGSVRETTADAARELKIIMRSMLDAWLNRGREIKVMGPVEAPIARLKGKYRWQLLVKSKNIGLMRHFLTCSGDCWKNRFRNTSVRLSIDIDPYNMV